MPKDCYDSDSEYSNKHSNKCNSRKNMKCNSDKKCKPNKNWKKPCNIKCKEGKDGRDGMDGKDGKDGKGGGQKVFSCASEDRNGMVTGYFASADCAVCNYVNKVATSIEAHSFTG